jgi:transposase
LTEPSLDANRASADGPVEPGHDDQGDRESMFRTPGINAARQTGMDRQTLRDWVLRYNEHGVDGLASRKPPGAAPRLSPAQMSELCDLVLAGPDAKTNKVVRWRCVDLREEVTQRFRVTVPERAIARWLRKLKLTRLQPRPFHPEKDEAAQEAFKKASVLC